MDRRKEELERKRQKLAELRKAREDRMRQQQRQSLGLSKDVSNRSGGRLV
jgi:dynein intermediate chain